MEARERAEAHWSAHHQTMRLIKPTDHPLVTYLMKSFPGELLECSANRARVREKLAKYPLDHSEFQKETGQVRIPCPEIVFDANLEEEFPFKVERYKIMCGGNKPDVLVHKFENMISPTVCQDLLTKWANFKEQNPIAHKINGGARSSEVEAYQLGIWWRMSGELHVSRDTRCEENPHAKKRGADFLRLVQRKVAGRIRELVQKYAPSEWPERQRCVVSFFRRFVPSKYVQDAPIYSVKAIHGGIPPPRFSRRVHNGCRHKRS